MRAYKETDRQTDSRLGAKHRQTVGQAKTDRQTDRQTDTDEEKQMYGEKQSKRELEEREDTGGRCTL